MKTLKIKRKISSTHLQIDELEKWMGKEVDIIIKEKDTGSTFSHSKSASGILSAFQNSDLAEEEKESWAKAVKEKYGNS